MTALVSRVARVLSQMAVYRIPDEAERCPACQSRSLMELDLLRTRRRADGGQIGFITGCRECGLVFSNPQPSREELAGVYSPDGWWGAPRAADRAERPMPAKRNRGPTRWIRQFDVIRDELSVTSPPPGASVLDFGCGAGRDLDSLRDYGWETWGIEPAEDRAFRRHHRLDTVPEEPRFDLVIANHVLEHVGSPLSLLRQLARACRPGGFLYVGVPRLDTLPVHRDYSYIINGRAHVMAYTWTCLRGLLARSGWNAVASPVNRKASERDEESAAKLRVIARRADVALPLPLAPLDEARAAIRAYHRRTPGRSPLVRLGLFRLAARRGEARLRHRAAVRRAAKHAETRVSNGSPRSEP